MSNFSSRRNLSSFLGLLLCTMLVAVVFAAAAQKKASGGSVLAADKGKFNILLDGKSIGHEEFEIAPSGGEWTAKGTTRLSKEGSAPTTVTGTLR